MHLVQDVAETGAADRQARLTRDTRQPARPPYKPASFESRALNDETITELFAARARSAARADPLELPDVGVISGSWHCHHARAIEIRNVRLGQWADPRGIGENYGNRHGPSEFHEHLQPHG
jgi:hypothetical protein